MAASAKHKSTLVRDYLKPLGFAAGLTFTFKPKKHAEYQLQTLFMRTSVLIVSRLRDLCPYWSLVPELTERGNLHYHLYVEGVTNKVRYSKFISWWRANYGFYCITSMSDYKTSHSSLNDFQHNKLRWVVYMRKEGTSIIRELSGLKKSTWNMITHWNHRKFFKKMFDKGNANSRYQFYQWCKKREEKEQNMLQRWLSRTLDNPLDKQYIINDSISDDEGSTLSI